MIDCAAMRTEKRKESATSEEQRFEKFGKALMAVPKKELDKVANDVRKKKAKASKRRS